MKSLKLFLSLLILAVSLYAQKSSVKSGRWSDPSVWGGSIPGRELVTIVDGHSVLFDVSTTIAGLDIQDNATLYFDSTKSVSLTSDNKNMVILGTLRSNLTDYPNNTHDIKFININNNNFVGGTAVTIVDSDIGIWVMAEGRLDIMGSPKTPFTNSVTSIPLGAKSVILKDVSGWKPKDEIVIYPTDKPPPNSVYWNRFTQTYTHLFLQNFERRIITSIVGNEVFFADALKYNHNAVQQFTPYVTNLTRNFKISGTAQGKPHIFISTHGAPGVHHNSVQNIKYIELTNLGPRKGVVGAIPSIVLSRYVLHLHHGGSGSTGSMIEGNSFHDNTSRAFVPHMSNGITFKNNSIFNNLGEACWWDFQEISHNITYDGNLFGAIMWDGLGFSNVTMMLGMGNDNVAKNNWIVYGNQGKLSTGGGYVWLSDNESVWTFLNNGANSNEGASWVWQNSPFYHTRVGDIGFNNIAFTTHGAYGNMYLYENNTAINSHIKIKATANAATAQGFLRSTFDGENKLANELILVEGSPFASINGNSFRESTFKNAKVGILLDCRQINPEAKIKIVDLINCDFINVTKQLSFIAGPLQSYFRVQPRVGSAYKVTQTGTTNIPDFAPRVWGTGDGFKGEYYNGANFETLAVTKLDPMLIFQQWGIKLPRFQLGVHNKIQNPFSIRWTGELESHKTETYTFRLQGAGGYRMWVDNVLILDSWTEKGFNTNFADSKPVALKLGQRHKVRIETFNLGGNLGFLAFWKSTSLPNFVEIPQSQVYSGL